MLHTYTVSEQYSIVPDSLVLDATEISSPEVHMPRLLKLPLNNTCTQHWCVIGYVV